jgi:3',5'-cyclic AMP phosphodiesterase CpdA
MRLVHLSDPHLTSLRETDVRRLRGKRLLGYLSWYRKRRHLHRSERLASLTEAVADESPDQILLTGDLVHIGMPEEIAAAGRWLKQLAPPSRVMLVPGNHDVYAGDSWPAVLEHWGPYMRGDGPLSRTEPGELWFPARRNLGDIGLVGLSSGCPTPAFLASGRLGPRQREKLGLHLKHLGNTGRFRCLLIHHPPVPGISNWRKALIDAGDLQSVLLQHGAELVLHGHLHRNAGVVHGHGTRVYGVASASCTSQSAPASYRVFDIETLADGWRVHMLLKTLVLEHGAVTVGEETWFAPRAGVKEAASVP